jgi:hypothetical protein
MYVYVQFAFAQIAGIVGFVEFEVFDVDVGVGGRR